MSLCGLPPELIAVILDTLTIPELLRCKQVCKQFSCIIEDVKFQYKIELAVSGMQDSPPNQVESAERLDMLRRQQEAWHAFQWNIYAFPTDTRSVDISGCVLLETTVNSDSSIKLTRAPSAHRRINDAGPSEWSLDNLGIILDTWIIDPSQDLLIATEIIKEAPDNQFILLPGNIHIRSLLTGHPHPKVIGYSSVISYRWQVAKNSKRKEIYEDYVGIFFEALPSTDEDNELVIWNWRTGEQQLMLHGKAITSFTFASDRFIIVAVVKDMGSTGVSPGLNIYDLELLRGGTLHVHDAQFTRAFHFPAPAACAALDPELIICTDPVPMQSERPSNEAFCTSQRDRLVVLRYWPSAVNPPCERKAWILCVHLSTLLDGWDVAMRNVPWSEWGPHKTRIIKECPPAIANPDASGMKMALVRATPSEGPHQVEIYDFSPLAVKRAYALAQSLETQSSMQIITHPTTIDHEHAVFQAPVTTSLPCIVYTASLPALTASKGLVNYLHTSILLREDHIVLNVRYREIREAA